METSYPLITIDICHAPDGCFSRNTCLMTHGTVKEATAQTKNWLKIKRCAIPAKIEIVCYDADANALHRECIDPATIFA